MRMNLETTVSTDVNHTATANTALCPGLRPAACSPAGLGVRAPVPSLCRARTSPAPSAQTPAEPAYPRESSSVLTLYMREIGQVQLLSREEEVELALRVQQGDDRAREEMIKANLRLVVKIARQYENMGLPLLDLISEGNIGLMKAVERYDPAKGAKLSVYSSFWIKQRIRRALSNHARTIRVPVCVQEKVQMINAASVRLQEILGRDPTDEEVAQEVGLPASKVRRMRQAVETIVSLDEMLNDQETRPVAEMVADDHATSPAEALARTATHEQLQEFMEQLSEREQMILRGRFGLDDEDALTLDSLGERLGLTRERIRQILNSALAKLRRHLEEPETIRQAA
jgi:RNA polymerase primary sigma factor